MFKLESIFSEKKFLRNLERRKDVINKRKTFRISDANT